ncbi:MAG: LysM peptidoglycan-binding domain-containing protein [Deltaproteobacteria bacterium]|nr:LysM peptidoglycan-binding domain-containing protein [Deltaproteobacteria bacterium]
MVQNLIRLCVFTLILSLFPSIQGNAPAFEIFPRPQEQYVVQRGDSLYSIAGKFYSNPDLWRILRNQNPGVLVKHGGRSPEKEPLIPGTKVFLYSPRASHTVIDETYFPVTGIPDEVRFIVNKVPSQGIPYDKQYFRYKLGSKPTQIWGYIVSSPEPNKTQFLERDLIYVQFRPSKKQVVLVGDRFGIYRDRGPLYHPVNPDREIGYVSDIVGEIEITSTGHDLITAIILESYVELERGDKVCLYAPRAREIIPSKTHNLLTGTILASATRDTFYSDSSNIELDIVFIDRGECHGLKEGTLLNIYRPTHPVADPYSQKWLSIPDIFVGEGMILKAFEKNSTVLITRTREEIVPGDIFKSVSD